MIPILVNKKTYSIKSIDELSTKEFIEFSRKPAPFSKLDYIAWQTGLSFDEVFVLPIPDSILLSIGEMPDLESLPIQKYIFRIHVKSHTIQSVGQRFMIETHGAKYEGYDLLVFVCAVALTRSSNIDTIEAMMDRLYGESFKNVLPVASFFLSTLRSGRNRGLISLGSFKRSIKMLKLRSRRALKS
jgi:hypothetical protein